MSEISNITIENENYLIKDSQARNDIQTLNNTISDLDTIRSNASSAKNTVDTHVVNTTIHVTAGDKIAWSQKQNAITDLEDIRTNAKTGADLAPQVEVNTQRIEDLIVSKFPNATPIGKPTIQGSYVSGFSNANYMQFPFVDISRGLPFDIYFSFTTSDDITTQQNILDSYFGIALAIKNSKGIMSLSSNGVNWDIGSSTGMNTLEPHTTYYAKYSWDGTQYTTALSTDNTTYIPDMSLNSTLSPHKTNIYIGGSPDIFGPNTSHPFKGTINFDKAKVYLPTIQTVVWEGMGDVALASRANVSLNNLDEVGEARFSAKQDTLVSGTNIKTINGESVLGEGNFDVSSIEPLTQEEYDRRKEAGELDENKYYSTPTDVSLQVLEALYPVGSLYITTNNTCPLQSLGIGTWILEAGDRVLQGAGNRGAVGTTINESLPNIKGQFQISDNVAVNSADAVKVTSNTGAFNLFTQKANTVVVSPTSVQNTTYLRGVDFNASRSSSTYQNNAPVQQNAYLVNIYRRIS